MEWSGVKSKTQLMQEALRLLSDAGNVSLDRLDLIELNSTKWANFSAATRKRKVAIATRICKIAQDSGWNGKLPRKPKILVDNAKSEFLTREQFKSVVDATQGEFMPAYLSFLYYTGARPDSEALQVQKEAH